jgi:hypothetical protein
MSNHLKKSTPRSNYSAQRLFSGTSTAYSYDGDQVIAEYNGATLLRKFVYGQALMSR